MKYCMNSGWLSLFVLMNVLCVVGFCDVFLLSVVEIGFFGIRLVSVNVMMVMFINRSREVLVCCSRYLIRGEWCCCVCFCMVIVVMSCLISWWV